MSSDAGGNVRHPEHRFPNSMCINFVIVK